MIRETVAPLRADVQKWLPLAEMSQNAFAKACGVHPSIASRVLNGALVSGPAEKKMRRGIERIKRRVVSRTMAKQNGTAERIRARQPLTNEA